MTTTDKDLFDDFIQVQNTIYSQVIEELTPAVKSVQLNLGDFSYAA